MKQESPRRPRAALLVSAAALLATPAVAQDATQAAPPPIQAAPQTTPQTAPVTPAPAPAPAATPSPDPQPQAAAPAAASPGSSPSSASDVPVDPQAAAEAAAEDAQLNAARRAGHRPTRARTYHPARRAAPVAAPTPSPAATAAPTPAPSAVPTPAPSATPTPTAHPPAREATPVPAAPEPAGTPGLATTRETTSTRAPVWPWVLLGLVVLAALAGALAWRRRRSDVEADWDATPPITPGAAERYVEPVAAPHVEPVAVTPTPVEPVAEPADAPRYLHRLTPLAAAPVAAAASATAAAAPVATPAVEPADIAPVAAEDVSVAAASADDIASLTAAAAPVADRPWLEFAMRPVRAGTTVDEALVEIELTVVNSGMVAAENVQIGTYLLAAGADAEIDRLLAAPLGEGAPAPVTIAAGEGTRVDATLALSRAELLGGAGQGSFQPVVVADARYPLPAGGEGRTSAAFLVGGIADDGDVLEPIVLSHTLLRDDVEARLYRKPQRR